MGIEPLAGRLLEENRTADLNTPADAAARRVLAARGMNVVINARAATALGFRDPRAAVGQQVRAELLGPDPDMVRAFATPPIGAAPSRGGD